MMVIKVFDYIEELLSPRSQREAQEVVDGKYYALLVVKYLLFYRI